MAPLIGKSCAVPSLFNPSNPAFLPPSKAFLPIFASRCRFSRMAQAEVQNNSPEIKEPLLKIPKLQQNGVHEVSETPVALFRVKKLSEKAILPSRASPLSAGYDLSRYDGESGNFLSSLLISQKLSKTWGFNFYAVSFFGVQCN